MSKWAFAGGGANPNGVINSIRLPPDLEDEESSAVVALVRSRLAAAAAGSPERTVPTGCPFDLFRPGLVVDHPVNRDYAIQKLQVSKSRRWAEVHGRLVTPPPLNAKVEQLIQEWFKLVDRDSSGTLDVVELEIALKSAQIPCTQESLTEMLELLDFNQDGVVDWMEFHTFISFQVHAGQDLLGGELELPSGLCLPLGPMIHKLRRQIVMDKIIEGGRQRRNGIGIAKTYLSVMKSVSHEDMTPAAQYAYAGNRKRKPPAHSSSSVKESPPRRTHSLSPARERERPPGAHSTVTISPHPPSANASPLGSHLTRSCTDASSLLDRLPEATGGATKRATIQLPCTSGGQFYGAGDVDMEQALLRFSAATSSRPSPRPAARSPRLSVAPRACPTAVPQSLAVLVRATQQARTMAYGGGGGAAARPPPRQPAEEWQERPGSPLRCLPESPRAPSPAAALPPRSGTAPANFHRGGGGGAALSPKPPAAWPPARPSTVSTAARPGGADAHRSNRGRLGSWSQHEASPPLSPYLFPVASSPCFTPADQRFRSSPSPRLHATPSPTSAARTSTQFVRASLQRDAVPSDAILLSLPRQSGVAVAHTLRLAHPPALDGRISSSTFTLVVGRNGF